MKLERKSKNYTLVIVIMCFVMEFFCLGFCSSNKSLYLTAITGALDLKRSLFAVNDSLRYLTTAAINLFFGILVQKLGVRKMMTIGFCALIGSALINSMASQIWMFYVGGVLLGAGLALTTTTMISYIIRHWVKERTGTVLGFVLAANGIGGAVAAQIITPIIYEEGNPFGYRNAYLMVAAVLAAVAVLTLVLYRDSQEEAPVPGKKKPRGEGWVGMEFSYAKTRPYFYMTLLGIFLTGMVIQGVNGITAAYYIDIGIEEATVATILSIHSLVLTATKFLAGYSYDKLGLRVTLIICQTAAILMNVLLLLVTATTGGVAIAMTVGVIASVAMPLETIMLSLITSDVFGGKSFDKMLGLVSAFNTAGYAAGAPLMNLCYDTMGSYVPIIIVAACLMAAVLILFQIVINQSYKDRQKILAADNT